ncbi:hypothetical protein [Streptomyces endophyticus]|uniref:Integral membrane protein n=1 Tax=Streptomyces endophyticus TaxID=714166 RepID=A0ABU6F6Q5_9ACTN|nr:hypothetical protein [Streptomyces endophyticus]MEB8339648.1 hypothetical protein [Streptomyces endophyticus]
MTTPPPQNPGPYGQQGPGYAQTPGYGQAPGHAPGYGYGYGYGYGPGLGVPPMMEMPSSVRVARVLAFVLVGLSIIGSIAMGALMGAEAAGQVLGSSLLVLVIGGFALRFGSAGNSARVTVIVLASAQILLFLSTMGRSRSASGILPLAGTIVVIVLLSQASARQWFKRPR